MLPSYITRRIRCAREHVWLSYWSCQPLEAGEGRITPWGLCTPQQIGAYAEYVEAEHYRGRLPAWQGAIAEGPFVGDYIPILIRWRDLVAAPTSEAL